MKQHAVLQEEALDRGVIEQSEISRQNFDGFESDGRVRRILTKEDLPASFPLCLQQLIGSIVSHFDTAVTSYCLHWSLDIAVTLLVNPRSYCITCLQSFFMWLKCIGTSRVSFLTRTCKLGHRTGERGVKLKFGREAGRCEIDRRERCGETGWSMRNRWGERDVGREAGRCEDCGMRDCWKQEMSIRVRGRSSAFHPSVYAFRA